MSLYHPESSPPVYPTQVTSWQTSDDVLGGDGGKANEPPLQLVERTNWLKYYLSIAQTAITALQAALASLAARVSSIESLLTPTVISSITDITNASLLTSGTLANARLTPEIRNSANFQTLTIAPSDTSVTIDLSVGGIVLVQLQNTAPCAIALTGYTAGQTGEIYFSSIYGTSRTVQMPASLPRVEVAAPDTRNLTVGTLDRALSYRVLPSNLIRATFIRDFA